MKKNCGFPGLDQVKSVLIVTKEKKYDGIHNDSSSSFNTHKKIPPIFFSLFNNVSNTGNDWCGSQFSQVSLLVSIVENVYIHIVRIYDTAPWTENTHKQIMKMLTSAAEMMCA